MHRLDALKQAMLEANKPELIKTESHVYEVWSHGEITLTKAGDLFRQRSLHQMAEPVIPKEAALTNPERTAKASKLFSIFRDLPNDSPEKEDARANYWEARKTERDPWSVVVASEEEARALRKKFIDYWSWRCNLTNG